MSKLEIVRFRPAQLEDAAGINDILIDRKADVIPGDRYEAHRQAGLVRRKATGVQEVEHTIRTALADPEHYFAQVAAVGAHVVAYAKAEALPDDEVVWWRGLSTAAGYQGKGIGGQLDTQRLQWAQSFDKSIRVLVVDTNVNSQAFLEHSGYSPVGIQEAANPEAPTFMVMGLGANALRGMVLQTRDTLLVEEPVLG
jgi:GNAT superfamily N-acetyltransferase